MKNIIVATFCFAVVAALPIELYKDESGNEYYVVPLNRLRRDTTWEIQGPDLTGVVKHEGTIIQGETYNLDGSAYAAKDLTDLKGLHKPELLGGDVKLTHDSGLSTVLAVDHFRGGPTDVKAGVNYDVYSSNNFNIDLEAYVKKHFAGALGGVGSDGGVSLTASGSY